MKPLIGITTSRQPSVLSWGPSVYAQNYQYSDAVLRSGGIPVFLPFTHTKQELRNLYDRLDAILFAGGGDIDPNEYGEKSGGHLKDVDTERDRIELQLMKWAIADDKPVLAICRGLQVLNVALGGTLIQDIPHNLTDAKNHDISTEKKNKLYIAHELSVEAGSRLATIIGAEPIGANSHHHQAIKKLAPGLQQTSRADDGIIESVELSRSRFVIGVQCHPESLSTVEPRWGKLFSEFSVVAESRIDYIPANARKSSITEAFEAL